MEQLAKEIKMLNEIVDDMHRESMQNLDSDNYDKDLCEKLDREMRIAYVKIALKAGSLAETILEQTK